MGGFLPLHAGCFHTLPYNCVQTPYKSYLHYGSPLQIAAVTAVLEKEMLPICVLYQIISFLAKKCIVASHLCNQLTINNLFEPLQLGFQQFHSI